jgi:hypothetical protein
MPERQHRLPSNYERLDEQITGPVLDSIVVAARSHGRLHLPGEYSTANRPPRHEVSITSADKNNSAVYREERLLGDPGHYLVAYDIWNHRDSASFAQIILSDESD